MGVFVPLFLIFCTAHAQTNPFSPLPGHVSKRIALSVKLGQAPQDEMIDLSLIVKLDQDLLDRTLAQIYGVPRAQRHYLSSDEFAKIFGLAEKRQKLKDFAAANGLAIFDDDPNSLVVKVAGKSSLAEKVFQTKFNRYQSRNGQIFRANETDPLVPTALLPHLDAVLGLSNARGALRPHIVVSKPEAQKIAAGLMTAPKLTGTTGVGGGLSPTDIKAVYSLSNVALDGSGQTVGIVEFDGYNPSDISLYENTYNLASAPLIFVSIDGQANLCGSSQNSPCNSTTAAGDNGMTEVALDIEMIVGLAPRLSSLRIYTAPNTNQGAIDLYAKIAADNLAKSVTTSWGEGEDQAISVMGSEATIFQQMAAQGQTLYAAAGDAGAYDDGGNTTLMTDDPASQPYVTGVGGTSLSGSIGGTIAETVWNNGYNSGQYSAGGGGIANSASAGTTYWLIPSYQLGVAGTASQTYRNVPDVTLNADPFSSPYSVCVGGNCANLVGGTSAAAPLWAGFTALVNQKLADQGRSPLGFANPNYYTIGISTSYRNAFNDIVSGNNGYYAAGAGYDNVSGWGSFKGSALIGLLAPTSSPITTLPRSSSDLSSVQVFPQPWEIGNSSRYWSNALTFSSLPAGTTVKIFTMMGELVASGTASTSGTMAWDGRNRLGNPVASGTYYAIFQSGSETSVKHIVIIR